MTWQETRKTVVENFDYTCALCGCGKIHSIDHALFPKAVHRRGMSIKVLNEIYNLLPLCFTCHRDKPKELYSPFISYKRWAWSVLLDKYGKCVMMEWYECVELVNKEKFW